MKRKWIMFVVAFLVAAIGFLKNQFGLIGIAALAAALTYIAGEFLNDVKRIGSQVSKFKDPAFWIAAIGSIFPVLNQYLFGGKVSQEMAMAIIGAVIPILVGIFTKRNSDLS